MNPVSIVSYAIFSQYALTVGDRELGAVRQWKNLPKLATISLKLGEIFVNNGFFIGSPLNPYARICFIIWLSAN